MPTFVFIALLAATAAPVQTPTTTQTASSTTKVASSPAVAKQSPATALSRKPVKAAGNPADAVITIHGLCATPSSAKNPAACTTVVTREQFDSVVNALNAIGPSLLPMQRRVVAEGYATTLVNYEAAKKAGLERDPRFAEVMRLARMRALGDMYRALQQEKAKKVSPEEIQAYYTKNADKLEELTTRRITLPRFNSANLKDEDFAAKARKVAGEVHDRMVQGEDLDQLQKEAYATLGVKDPPTTKMGVVRRGVFSADQEKQLFALKPGEITQVIELPSAFIIFKLEGRENPSLEKAKDEITHILVKQHLDQQEQARNSDIQIEYNEQYVGAAQASGWMPASQLNATDHTGSAPKGPAGKSAQPK